jgi:hypothetical protein
VIVSEHGLDAFADDLRQAQLDIRREVAKVTGKALNLIKRDAQRRVRGYPHLPHLPRSFTYDVKTLTDRVVGQVGAEHERLQGKLDVFIEFGSPTSAPIPHWRPAADAEVPVWESYLEQAAVDAVGDRA